MMRESSRFDRDGKRRLVVSVEALQNPEGTGSGGIVWWKLANVTGVSGMRQHACSALCLSIQGTAET
jgi:hypothetical protein